MDDRAVRRHRGGFSRYLTNLSVDEVQARLRRAVDPPGVGEKLRRLVREPSRSRFQGIIEDRGFWIRLSNRNTWKPTAHGRIDGVDGGSVVSVEFTRPDASWFVPAIVVIYAVAFGAATFAYGGFPPADLVVGATAVAVFGVALGVIAPRIADHEQQEIETLLRDVLEANRGRE